MIQHSQVPALPGEVNPDLIHAGPAVRSIKAPFVSGKHLALVSQGDKAGRLGGLGMHPF